MGRRPRRLDGGQASTGFASPDVHRPRRRQTAAVATFASNVSSIANQLAAVRGPAVGVGRKWVSGQRRWWKARAPRPCPPPAPRTPPPHPCPAPQLKANATATALGFKAAVAANVTDAKAAGITPNITAVRGGDGVKGVLKG